MKTYRKVVLTKVTLYYINSSNSTNCFYSIWYDFNHNLRKSTQKLFIINVKIASVLNLVICLVLVGPSSPSKLKLYGAISWAEDKNFCAQSCSGSKIFAQPIVTCYIYSSPTHLNSYERTCYIQLILHSLDNGRTSHISHPIMRIGEG